jgi:hypothetical protein
MTRSRSKREEKQTPETLCCETALCSNVLTSRAPNNPVLIFIFPFQHHYPKQNTTHPYLPLKVQTTYNLKYL